MNKIKQLLIILCIGVTFLSGCNTQEEITKDSRKQFLTSLIQHVEEQTNAIRDKDARELTEYMMTWETVFQKQGFLDVCDDNAKENLWQKVIPDLQVLFTEYASVFTISSIEEEELDDGNYKETIHIQDANEKIIVIQIRMQIVDGSIHFIELQS